MMKALLTIAGKVQKGGKHVTCGDVARAKQEGATDKEVHDTVLIAAAFCMFNRYVDGLGTWQPSDPEIYREIGMLTAQLGCVGQGLQAFRHPRLSRSGTAECSMPRANVPKGADGVCT